MLLMQMLSDVMQFRRTSGSWRLNDCSAVILRGYAVKISWVFYPEEDKTFIIRNVAPSRPTIQRQFPEDMFPQILVISFNWR